MRIWIENPFDNLPIEGFRAQRYWLMAEAFQKAGHEVVLWTSDFNHTTKCVRVLNAKDANGGQLEMPSPRLNTAAAFASSPQFSVKFIKTIPYSKNVSIRRIVSHILYAISWYHAATKLLKPLKRLEPLKPDVIILSTPPICTGFVALYFKKRFGAKVILDIMDLWPETFERVAPKWVLKPMKWLADFIRGKADLVTSVAKVYPGETFYHGIKEVRSKEVRSEGSNFRTGKGECLGVAYIGNLGVTYDLKTVLEAVGKIEGAVLKIAGEGVQAPMIAEKAAESKGKIEYLGYLGKEEMEKLLKESDIGVIPMAPESCVGVPYKFADYAASSLAIVSSLGGESAALLEKYGAGEEYKPHEAESLIKAIEKLRPRLEEAKRGARKMAEEELDAEKIYRRYVEYVTANMI